MQAVNRSERKKLKDWTDVFFSTNTGYIAVTNFKKQFFYGSNDVEKLKRLTEGKKDLYISVNSFKGWHEVGEPTRRLENLKQIRNIAIDIDQYNKGISISEAIDELYSLIIREIIPEPNLVLTSRGIQLFYNIENGASPNERLAWWVTYINEQLVSKLKHIGADPKVKDLSRVMRLPNTINSRNNSIVKPEIWNDIPYTLNELYSYCTPYETFRSKRLKRHKKTIPFGNKLTHIVNYSRLIDLERLIELKKGDFTGMRNEFIYIYAFHQSLLESTFVNLMYKMQDVRSRIYSKDGTTFSQRELENTVKKAYKDAETFHKYLVENNFQIVYKHNDGIRKPYTSNNLAERLGITELPLEEQLQFKTILSDEARRIKENRRIQAHRRAKGVRPRQEYEDERKQRKEMLMQQIKALKEQGLSNKKIAKELGISNVYVGKLLKELGGLTGVYD